MTISAGNGYFVKIPEKPERGSAWIVRLYRRSFFVKRLVMSDWFLDQEQARTFGEQLSREIKQQGSIARIEHRKPGWMLRGTAR